jgi:hypothetical protein
MNIILTAIISIIASVGIVQSIPDRWGGGEALFGAISFPTSLDTLTNPTDTDTFATVNHADQHSDANDAVEALQAKVGADGSAVTTSHDYKLSGVTGSDKACSLAGTETLTNKTLTSPGITGALSTTTTLIGTTTFTTNGDPLSVDLGSDATGDIFYRNSAGNFTRLPIGSANEVLKVSSGLPSWESGGAGITTSSSTGATTLTATTSASQRIMVWANGYLSGAVGQETVSLQYDGVTYDSTLVNTGGTETQGFSLMLALVPGAQTADIGLTKTDGTFNDLNIIMQIY